MNGAAVQWLAAVPEHRATRRAFWIIALVLLVIANLPWHLDNYDQAKQAFVAFEIVETGEWWFQHTPQGKSASKPPLQGWVSAALYLATRSWDLAWRLPGFLCAVAVMMLLARAGDRVFTPAGGTLAAAAFVFTFLTPRIATLVRTDMALALTIFAAGLLIYQRIGTATGWTNRTRWLFAAIVAVSLYLKGPVIYAFLLPGVVLFALTIRDRELRRLAWPGFWPWLLPFAVFLIWATAGILTRETFYRDVVEIEFLTRFSADGRPAEASQPIWFYLPHLLHKFLPWTILALGLPLLFPTVRQALRNRPGAWWLACWTVGGILLMTLIPSKRVDRIYPVLLPAALLIPHLLAPAWKHLRVRAASGVCLLAALGLWGGYYAWIAIEGMEAGNRDLIELAERTRAELERHGNPPLGILTSRDEGLLIYLGVPGFLGTSAAAQALQQGTVEFLLTPERRLATLEDFVGPVETIFEVEVRRKNEAAYRLVRLPEK